MAPPSRVGVKDEEGPAGFAVLLVALPGTAQADSPTGLVVVEDAADANATLPIDIKTAKFDGDLASFQRGVRNDHLLQVLVNYTLNVSLSCLRGHAEKLAATPSAYITRPLSRPRHPWKERSYSNNRDGTHEDSDKESRE
jgi:hypothetical protein